MSTVVKIKKNKEKILQNRTKYNKNNKVSDWFAPTVGRRIAYSLP